MNPFYLGCLAVALLLACFLSPMASEKPDGLDRFAEDHGIEAGGDPFWTRSPMADYAAPFAASDRLRTGFAGGLGTLLVFGTLLLGGKVVANCPRRKPQPTSPEAQCKP